MRTFVEVEKLRIHAYHGVMEHERRVGGLFEVSVKLVYDFCDAAAEDNLSKALNYAELTELIKDVMKTPRNLIEAVAMEIRNRIAERWPAVEGGTVRVTKLHPPIPAPAPEASVAVEWE